jgi:D-alanyl-D-alanine carboxypeptidase
VASVIEAMLDNARKQGVEIRVFSAYRSYDKPRCLYLEAVYRYGPDQNRVAEPGHSEHQLGTAVDRCGMDPKTVLSPDFDLTRKGRWLKENAPRFGFYQSYTRENRHLTGYIREPWHYRYYGIWFYRVKLALLDQVRMICPFSEILPVASYSRIFLFLRQLSK